MNKSANINNKNIVNVIISNDKVKRKQQRRKRANAVDLTHDVRFNNMDNLQTEILRQNLMNAEQNRNPNPEVLSKITELQNYMLNQPKKLVLKSPIKPVNYSREDNYDFATGFSQESPVMNRENPNQVHFIRNGNANEDVNVQSEWDDIQKETILPHKNEIETQTEPVNFHSPKLVEMVENIRNFGDSISRTRSRSSGYLTPSTQQEIGNDSISSPTTQTTPTKNLSNEKIRIKIGRGRPRKGVTYIIPSQDVLKEQARQKQRDDYKSKVSAVNYANDMNSKLLSGELIPAKQQTQEEMKKENNDKTFGLNNNIRTFSNK
jgi:hypothetical protein